MEFGRSPHWTQSARIGSANAGLFLGCVLTAMSCTMVGLPTYSEGSEGSPAAVTVEAPAADLFAPAPPANGYDPQRALLPLSEIADNPAAPKPKAAADPELPRQALRHLEEARRLFAEQRFSETVAETIRALRYHSDIAEAHRLAALASLFLGKNAEAFKSADAVIALRPDDLPSRYVRARLAEKADEPEVALAEYRTALKCPAPVEQDEYLVLTHHQLGLLLHELGYYRAAVDQLTAFERAVARTDGEPRNPELSTILRVKRTAPLLALADAQEALQHYGPAADTLAGVLQRSPDDKAVRVKYIKNLVRARRFRDAQAQAAAHAAANKDLKSAELLVAVHRAAGQPGQALSALENLVGANPDKTDLVLFYADNLIASKQFEKAVKVLDGLADRGPDATAARWKLISIHRAQGNYRDWVMAMGAMLAANPGDASRALAELAQLQDQHAAEVIQQALEERADASRPAPQAEPATLAGYYYCLGWLANRLDRPEQAQTLYDRALQAKPDFLLAGLGVAELWIDRCAWDKALAALQNAPSSDDPVLASRLSRAHGLCHDGLDQLTEAEKHYRQALRQHPDLETHVLLGRLLERFQKFDEAARVYEQALKPYPDAIEVRELLVMNRLSRWSEGDNLKLLLAQAQEMQKTGPEHPATLRTAALVRLLMRQPPDLANYIRVLTSLVETRPDDVHSRRALAVGLIRTTDYESAVRELEVLLEKDPHDSQNNELLAVVRMRQLKIDAAAGQLARSLTWYPNREALIRNLAETHLVRQDYDAAAAMWERALALEHNTARHPQYRGRLISTFIQAGWFDKVRERSEAWLEEADEDELATIRSYLLAADAAQDRHDQYVERCREWLTESPEDDQIKHWLVGVGPLPGQARGGLIGAGRLDEAVAQATAWAAKAPENPVIQHLLLQTLRTCGRYHDLVEICRANLSLADKPQQRLVPLQLLADALRMLEQHDEAIAAVKEMANQASQITESDLGFHLDELMVTYLTQARRYNDAIAQANRILTGLSDREARLQQLVAEDSDDVALRVQVLQAQEKLREQRAHVLRTLSFVYTRQENRDQAIDCLKQALKLTPNDAGLNNDLGYTLADAGLELDEAQRMLEAAVSEVLWNGVGEDSRQAAFLDSLGWLYYKRGQFEQARHWLALGARMEDGQDAVIHDHLGDAQWRLGQRDAAVESWKHALELHDRKVKEEKSDPDEKLVASIEAKLEQAAREGKPAVATSTAD